MTVDELDIEGVQEIEFQLNNRNCCHQFSVCSLPGDADGIIGMDFLLEKNAKLDLEKQELRLFKCSNFNHGSLDWTGPEANGTADH